MVQTMVLLLKIAAKLMDISNGAGVFNTQHVTFLRQIETENNISPPSVSFAHTYVWLRNTLSTKRPKVN